MKVKDAIRAGHAEQYLEAIRPEGATLMRYAVVVEKANGNYSLRPATPLRWSRLKFAMRSVFTSKA